MPKTFRRDPFTWLAYLLLAFYGFFLNILGPITPFLKDELDLSYTVGSLYFTAFAVGILIVGLGGRWVINRIGRWRSLWLGAFGMSVSVVLLLVGQTPAVTVGAAFSMGLVGSLILIIVPSALSDQHGEMRPVALSEANVIASLVSSAAPLLVGWFARLPGGWRTALALAALTPLLMSLVFRKAAPPPAAASPEQESHRKRQPLPILFWVYWTALVLAISVEFCMISWSAGYLEKAIGMPMANAAQAVSLFLAAMILGRLVGSKLVQRFSTHKLVMLSILTAGAGFSIYWAAKSAPLALAGLFITGLGVASLYPLIQSLAIGTAPNNTIQASERTTLASGVAILALPLVLGGLADAVGIRLAYGVVALLLVSVFIITQIASRSSLAGQPVEE